MHGGDYVCEVGVIARTSYRLGDHQFAAVGHPLPVLHELSQDLSLAAHAVLPPVLHKVRHVVNGSVEQHSEGTRFHAARLAAPVRRAALWRLGGQIGNRCRGDNLNGLPIRRVRPDNTPV